MGSTATSTGVTFRAGPFTPSGERVAHDLVVRYSMLDCVNDNTRCLEDADFPVDGSVISFGSHRIYVAVVVDSYPTKVLSYNELPPAGDRDLSHNIDDVCDRVEVLTITSLGGASGGVHSSPCRFIAIKSIFSQRRVVHAIACLDISSS
ncbi:hypothetical protein D1007_52053 [Hordeum vulgare]|nr:hypothetical protein D1007_52053 [Hordeum vulgare]